MLGSLAFMLLRQSVYIDAVFRTLVSIAAVLLLMAWAWNPRPGFSGVGVHLVALFADRRPAFRNLVAPPDGVRRK